jgi:hypothetical protein
VKTAPDFPPQRPRWKAAEPSKRGRGIEQCSLVEVRRSDEQPRRTQTALRCQRRKPGRLLLQSRLGSGLTRKY